MTAAKTLLVMAGGTGGHVFPALATADCLRQQGWRIEWLGSHRGIENRLVPEAGIRLHRISVAGLRGKGRLSLLLAPFKLVRALWQALAVIRKVNPDAVLGMGGFASGPGGLAAWILRKPLLVHEQNAIPGLTNRLLAHLSARPMEAFPGAFAAKYSALHTGNPVRGDIARLDPPEQRFSGRKGPLRLLVVGGSLGARAINECLPKSLALFPAELRPEVWHQAGANNIDRTRLAYQQSGVPVRLEAFVEDMQTAYGWADLVICRAGALTVSELAMAGVGSVLVPFPFAVDDHQTANSRYLVDKEAAILLPQAELSPERLLQLLQQLDDRDLLLAMAQRARALATPRATALVAQQCQESVL
ncbi:MAG: UDP-N-acetylglucosamine--N-acetylmuramyl-(pentapeptide) pyrophosphoryl-undecaprenol N-acetylglucosamine transferase [Motiliproteus sp.]|jgi:UDP-N-acetylglucosamine--N-acetylmuramyl-(pentapeptide) pyrophosphoryl-undecaprenol N-acetylglucosamine transferase